MNSHITSSGNEAAVLSASSQLRFRATGELGWHYLGNIVEAKEEKKVEYFDHYRSENGKLRRDIHRPKKVDYGWMLKLDEHFGKNLELYCASKEGIVNDQPAGSITTQKISIDTGEFPRQYKLIHPTTLNPIVGATITAVAAKTGDADGTPTTLTEGTHFTYDAQTGTITLLSTSTEATADQITVSATFPAVKMIDYTAMEKVLHTGEFEILLTDEVSQYARRIYRFTGGASVSEGGDFKPGEGNVFSLDVYASTTPKITDLEVVAP